MSGQQYANAKNVNQAFFFSLKPVPKKTQQSFKFAAFHFNPNEYLPLPEIGKFWREHCIQSFSMIDVPPSETANPEQSETEWRNYFHKRRISSIKHQQVVASLNSECLVRRSTTAK